MNSNNHEKISAGVLFILALLIGALIGFFLMHPFHFPQPQEPCKQVTVHVPPYPDRSVTVCPGGN